MYTLTTDRGVIEATQEQIAIINAATGTKDNLLINALAGAAKSTTLQFICKYVTGIPILSLAFNKRIATELEKKLPSHVDCRTLNGLGHRVWGSAVGKRLVLDDKKMFTLMKEWSDKNLKGADKEAFFDEFGDIKRCLGWAKSMGWVPQRVQRGKSLFDSDESFFSALNENVDIDPRRWRDCLVDCIARSISMAYDGVVDFDDQIYMPTLFGGAWPVYPLTLVDETQDLSPLNHVLLQRLVGPRRLIAVGDPWQSIYGFRGAARGGMAVMKSTFNMTELTLSVSFRCPQEIVKRQHTRVPHMKWADWAVPGEVRSLERWGSGDIPDGAAIICRNNAPLFKLALQLIRDGRGVKVLGADIGPALIKVMKKLGDGSLSDQALHNAIDNWATAMIAKGKAEASTYDRAECMHVFADAGKTLAGAIAFAEDLFKRGGTIELMSGHKSKGLEYDTVFHLDPKRVPSPYAKTDNAIDQELNLQYVIETRAKKQLFFVEMETYG